MLATTALVRRIEATEARLVALAGALHARRGTDGAFVTPLGGGVAVYAGPGSPFNKLAGLGFEPLDLDALAAVEARLAARATPPRVELATHADPGVLHALGARGYVLAGHEHVLGCALAARPGGGRAAPGVHVRPAREDEARVWIDAVTTGFLHPDEGATPQETFGREALEAVFSDMLALGAVEPWLAWRDGAVAGGASLRLDAGVAQLAGAATLPPHRRHGVQSALVAARLAAAAARGADLAVVTTEPGSRSQENAQRAGFALLYARAVLQRAV